MIRPALFALLVLLPVPGAAERRRDMKIHAIAGVVSPRDVLRTENQARFVSGFSARMHLVDRAGYFVDVHLAPVRRRSWAQDLDWTAIPRDYKSALFAYFAVGPFYTWRAGSLDTTYRVGYGAAGDGRTAADLVYHALTLGRTVSGRLYGAVDLSQALTSLHTRGAVSLALGLGLRL